jgi:hypothetical protein
MTVNVHVHVNKVKREHGPLWSVQLEGNPRVSYYGSKQEANVTAICAALEAVSRRVGESQTDVSGLSLQIVIGP